MQESHAFLVTLHIVVGAIALVLFWVPVLAAKGGRLHVRVGRIYVIAMYVVSISAFLASVLALIDPVGIRRPDQALTPEDAARLAERSRMFSTFLLMLSVLVFSALRHGLLALRERSEPGALRRPGHVLTTAALGVLGVIVGVLGIRDGHALLIVFAVISIAGAISQLRDMRKQSLTRSERVVAHLGGLIGTGIGAYTAFFAFGGARFFAELLPGQWQLIAWIMPSIIGTIFTRRLTRRYSRARSA